MLCNCCPLLWVDEILHRTEVNHGLLAVTGESSFQGFLGGAGFRPSTVVIKLGVLIAIAKGR